MMGRPCKGQRKKYRRRELLHVFDILPSSFSLCDWNSAVVVFYVFLLILATMVLRFLISSPMSLIVSTRNGMIIM